MDHFVRCYRDRLFGSIVPTYWSLTWMTQDFTSFFAGASDCHMLNLSNWEKGLRLTKYSKGGMQGRWTPSQTSHQLLFRFCSWPLSVIWEEDWISTTLLSALRWMKRRFVCFFHCFIDFGSVVLYDLYIWPPTSSTLSLWRSDGRLFDRRMRIQNSFKI